MHPAQQQFVERVKNLFPEKFLGVDVLDVGSLDINGNNRYHFASNTYTGVDIGPGKNVDVVVDPASSLPFNDNHFDVVISTECMEHNPYYQRTIHEMYRVLKPNGLLIMTMAGHMRPEHGTYIADPVASPYTHDYYKNIYLNDMTRVFYWENFFFPFCFEYAGAYDLYFYGIKRV